MMAFYRPQANLREEPLDPTRTAVLFVDVQVYNASKDGAIFKGMSQDQQESEEIAYYFASVADSLPRWRLLQDVCRNSGVQIVYTTIQSLTQDGRDRSLDYKISGFHCPPNSKDAAVLPELTPGPNEPILPKTSSSVFQSTCCDFILRNMGIKQLVVAGCVTDQARRLLSTSLDTSVFTIH